MAPDDRLGGCCLPLEILLQYHERAIVGVGLAPARCLDAGPIGEPPGRGGVALEYRLQCVNCGRFEEREPFILDVRTR